MQQPKPVVMILIPGGLMLFQAILFSKKQVRITSDSLF